MSMLEGANPSGFVLALALLAIACVDPPPQIGDPPRVAEAAPVQTPALAAQPGATAVPDAWQHVAKDLEAENRALTEERDRLKAEAERQRVELERATGDAKRAAEQAAAAARYAEQAARATQAQAAPQPQARLVMQGPPAVALALDYAVVTAVVWNVGQVPARGNAMLELLLNGASIGTASIPINIPGGVQSTFTHSFRIDSNRTGTYAARISFAG